MYKPFSGLTDEEAKELILKAEPHWRFDEKGKVNLNLTPQEYLLLNAIVNASVGPHTEQVARDCTFMLEANVTPDAIVSLAAAHFPS
jgi:hypothetical protein